MSCHAHFEAAPRKTVRLGREHPSRRPPHGLRRLGLRRAAVLLALTAAGTVAAAAPPTQAHGPHAAHPRLGRCAAGQLCLWGGEKFRGGRRTFELSGTPIESCVPLPKGATTASFANRTGRPVTLYQSRECAGTGEFKTFPSGSWTPHSSYRARALKIWER